MEPNRWRYIPPLTRSARMQRAIDVWLLEQHRLGHYPPSLRFYPWFPPAISLGYHPRPYPDFWQGLTWQDRSIWCVDARRRALDRWQQNLS